MNKEPIIKSLFQFILCIVLLTGCEVPESSRTLPTGKGESVPGVKTIPIIQTDSQAEIIGPDNVDRLQVVDIWGQGNVYGVTLSPDEMTLAVATTTGVYLYDRHSLQLIGTIDLPMIRRSTPVTPPARAVAFSPDGNLLAMGYGDIIIWNLTENQLERVINKSVADYDIVQVAFSPQGDTITAVTRGGYAPCDGWGGNFSLYDLDTSAILYNDYFCPESALYHFTFTNNNKAVFVGSSDRGGGYEVSIVDASTGLVNKEIIVDGQVDSVSPDGSKISVRYFQDSPGTTILETNTQKAIDTIDGTVIYLPGNHGQLVIRDMIWAITTSEHKEICRFGGIPNISFNVYRSAYYLIGTSLLYWNRFTQRVEIWDVSNCQNSGQLFIPIRGDDLEYSKNGKILATNDQDTVSLWDGVTGDYLSSTPEEDFSENSFIYPIHLCAMSTDGATIISVRNTIPYIISIWNATSGKVIDIIETNYNYLDYIALSSDGAILATIDHNGIRLWDVENRVLLATIPGRFGKIHFNPNGKNFAMVEGNSIGFRNSRTGEIEKSINIANNKFEVAFSKDWSYFAITEGKELELMDIDGTPIRDFIQYTPLASDIDHSKLYDFTYVDDSQYYNIEFSPDNNLLVAISYEDKDNSLRFWDTRTGTILRDLNIPFRISSMTFSPDGRRLTLSSDGVIYILGILQL